MKPQDQLRQLTLNQTLSPFPTTINPTNPQPTLTQQILPILPRTFPRRQQRQHHDIQTCGLPVSARIRNHVLVDQQLAVPGLHGGGDVGEDLEARAVGPVVEDGVHEVGSGAWGG